MGVMTVTNALRDEVDRNSAVRLTDLLERLGAVKGRVAAVTVAGMVVSIVVALTVPRYYVATTLLLPSQQQSGAGNGAIAQLGSLVGVAGTPLPVKSNDELFIGLMKSRSILGAVTKKFDLVKHYGAGSDVDAQKVLMARTTITSDRRAGLLSLSVEDVDPKLAADLANYYMVELERLTSTLTITEAQQRRAFFEEQVAKTRSKLNAAELRFAQLQRDKGFLMTDVLAEAGVRGGVEVRQQIAAREVQLAALQRFATNENPEAKRLSAEIQALRQKQTRLEEGQVSSAAYHPETIETVNAYREVKVYTGALEGLVRQLELSRLDEAKDTPSLQQIDPAVAPEYPVKPSRVNIVLGGTVLSAGFASFFAMASYALGRMRSPRWAKVRAAWGWR